MGAGRRWPTPLLEQAWALRHPAAPVWLALALVIGPPLLIAWWLLAGPGPFRRSSGRSNPDRGESSD
ncbi:MAG: hypothetical protein ACO3FA_07060 [Vulcanococcus sp.]